MSNLKQVKTILLLDYMIHHGLRPERDEKILELGSDVNTSLSQVLKKYQQYLLSRDVNYDELEKYGILGAFGYVENGEIIVPRTLYNDRYLLDKSELSFYDRQRYNHPTIDEFSTIVSKDLTTDLFHLPNIRQNLYLGLCLSDIDSQENKEKLEQFKNLVKHIRKTQQLKYELVQDTDSYTNQKVYLIKRRGKKLV